MTSLQQAYTQGFIDKCAARGIDPEGLVKKAQATNKPATKQDPWLTGTRDQDTINKNVMPPPRAAPAIRKPAPVKPSGDPWFTGTRDQDTINKNVMPPPKAK